VAFDASSGIDGCGLRLSCHCRLRAAALSAAALSVAGYGADHYLSINIILQQMELC
jgi:hypothetical protein